MPFRGCNFYGREAADSDPMRSAFSLSLFIIRHWIPFFFIPYSAPFLYGSTFETDREFDEKSSFIAACYIFKRP